MRPFVPSLIGVVSSVFATQANAATPITVSMRIEINRVEGGPPSLAAPLTFDYIARFDGSSAGIYDAGVSTYTNFVTGKADAISSNVFSLLPKLAQDAIPYQSIAGRSNDYSEVFINQIGFSDQRYYDANAYLGQTVTELFFDVRTASQGGTGSADRPLSLTDITSILEVGKTANFFVFDRIYDPANTRTTWSGTATIVSVTTAVPESATWLLMLSGFAMSGYVLRRRKMALTLACGAVS